MKFDYGRWQLLPGTQAIYPLTIIEVKTDADSLTVSGYDHTIRTRDDYIHGTLITARFSSPIPDVLRIQWTHFKGGGNVCLPSVSIIRCTTMRCPSDAMTNRRGSSLRYSARRAKSATICPPDHGTTC